MTAEDLPLPERPRAPDRRTRLAIALDRDGSTCAWCGRTFAGSRRPTTEHLVPRAKGGPSWVENELAACARCNRVRGVAALVEPTPTFVRRSGMKQPGWSVVIATSMILLGSACSGIEAAPTVAAGSPSAVAPMSPSVAAEVQGTPPRPCANPPGAATADRRSLQGRVAWARFCPGPVGRTFAAHVPSATLTSHLELLGKSQGTAGITVGPQPTGETALTKGGIPYGCRPSSGRSYRLLLGFADGRVAQVRGNTDPTCTGHLRGTGEPVRGPQGLGVYGVVMQAFGAQHADVVRSRGTEVRSDGELRCPASAQRPESTVRDGASVDTAPGWRNGRGVPLVMPATAAGGIACTYPYRRPSARPEARELAARAAERVRIGLHAVDSALVDCVETRDPTTVAVVEDAFGTRRAVSIDDSCAASVRGSAIGTGFAWLDR